jgi:hypothetical protein
LAKRQKLTQCKEKAKQAKELEKQKGAQAARAKKLEEKEKRTIFKEAKASEKVLAIMEGKIRRVTKTKATYDHQMESLEFISTTRLERRQSEARRDPIQGSWGDQMA